MRDFIPTIQNGLILFFSLCPILSFAQKDSISYPYHKSSYKWELPLSAAFLFGSSYGFNALERYASLTEEQVKNLNPNINRFDRPVAFYEPSEFDKAHHRSNVLLNIAVASPAILLLDKKVRNDFITYTNLLLLAHTVNNAAYFATAFSIRRARPLTYNPRLSLEERSGEQKTNSFFSGHVSFSATSTFFVAKTYTDYHQIKGGKRILIYTAAAIPPALVGYYRVHAGKHFKTDVITGLFVGAACGILIPELHRNRTSDIRLNKKRAQKIAFSPLYYSGASGISVSYCFK